MLQDLRGADVRVLVVWVPMLATDWAPPGAGVLARVSDPRALQYWDKNHLVANELVRAIAADPEHPRPNCCEDGGILWDLVGVYPSGVRWEETLPRASLLDGPVWRVHQLRDAVRQQLDAGSEGSANGP